MITAMLNQKEESIFPKEELAQFLRAFQASSDKTKSDARDDVRRAEWKECYGIELLHLL